MPARTRKAGRPALTRERIARAALVLLDREGPEGFSMRTLAAELGTGTMTLYGYFRSKDELLDAAVDVAVEEVGVDIGEGTWKDQMRALMLGIREGLARHPGGIRLRLARPILTPGALRFTEAALQILKRAGFDAREATRIYQTLFFYTFGVASFGSPAAPDEVKRRARATLLALPPEHYPELTAAADEAAEALAAEDQFERGLDQLLDALEGGGPSTTKP